MSFTAPAGETVLNKVSRSLSQSILVPGATTLPDQPLTPTVSPTNSVLVHTAASLSSASVSPSPLRPLMLCYSTEPGTELRLFHPDSFPRNNHVLVIVSMNNEVRLDGSIKFSPEDQTGAGLEAMLDTFIANPKIDKLTILTTLDLQRYNKVLELIQLGDERQLVCNRAGKVTDVSKELKDRAEELVNGDLMREWYKQNSLEEPAPQSECRLLNKLRGRFPGGNFQIIHWQDLRQNSIEFQTRHKSILSWYRSGQDNHKPAVANREFIGKFNKEVVSYRENIERALRSHVVLASTALQKLTNELQSRNIRLGGFIAKQRDDFILEETAMLSVLGAPGSQYSHIVYRGNIGSPLRMAYNIFNCLSCLMGIGTMDQLTERHIERSQEQRSRLIVPFPSAASSTAGSVAAGPVNIQITRQMPAQTGPNLPRQVRDALNAAFDCLGRDPTQMGQMLAAFCASVQEAGLGAGGRNSVQSGLVVGGRNTFYGPHSGARSVSVDSGRITAVPPAVERTPRPSST